MGLVLQGFPPVFPVADFFFSAPAIYFAWRKDWGGVCTVGQCQRFPWDLAFGWNSAACETLPAFVECFPGQGPVGPFLDGVFQD